MDFKNFAMPFSINQEYQKKVAYFSMEFALDQSLKIYSGGLGFLAGSHMRSAYNLKQDLVGIGILWKFGYYDQARNHDQTLQPTWTVKMYSFLEDTGIKFQIEIHSLHHVNKVQGLPCLFIIQLIVIVISFTHFIFQFHNIPVPLLLISNPKHYKPFSLSSTLHSF